MADVVSFRPDSAEKKIIEAVRRARGLRSRAAAVRLLVRKGAEREGPVSEDPVFQYRVPKRFQLRRSLTSREIDEELYGR